MKINILAFSRDIFEGWKEGWVELRDRKMQKRIGGK